MLYSNACAYAIRAMTRLAMVRPDGYVLLDELCEGSDLPRHFVAKIFQDLVRKGILVSAKGRGGGFALGRPPHRMRLMDIVAVIDGTEQFDRCIVGLAGCDSTQPCPHHEQWQPIRDDIRNFLEGTTLADMAETLKVKLTIIGQPLPEPKSRSKPVRPTH